MESVHGGAIQPLWVGNNVRSSPQQASSHRRLEAVAEDDEKLEQPNLSEGQSGFGVVDAIEAVFGSIKQQERF